MKSKIGYQIVLCVLLLASLLSLLGCEEEEETQPLPDWEAEITEAKTFTRTEEGFYRDVAFDCEDIDFSEEFTLSVGAKWYLCKDRYGTEQILTKSAPLAVGDNCFYAVVFSSDEAKTSVYSLVVHKKAMYSVIYRVDGETYATYSVEEGAVSEVPTVPLKKGYIFEKWDVDLAQAVTENTTVQAVFQKCTEHVPDEKTCICTRCGETDMDAVKNMMKEETYFRTEDIIYFGFYPQREVTDRALTDSLTEEAGTLPRMDRAGKWTSYSYYSNGEKQDYMWYIDCERDGERYRGVYFNKYRPSWCLDTAGRANSYVDNNGYETGKVYWFEYLPICWRILREEEKELTLFAELILDSREYDCGEEEANGGYENSAIRKWLCEDFFTVAFEKEQSLIMETVVDNSAKSTNPCGKEKEWNNGKNPYAGEDTVDKVYLLSVEEVTDANNGFVNDAKQGDIQRQKGYSDYALCMGLRRLDDTVGASWWLRSLHYSSDNLAYYVRYDGRQYANYIRYGCFGVVPAVTIKLPE